MTNGPTDQPMSNAELQAAITNLTTVVTAGFERTQQQIDANAEAVRQTNLSVQSLRSEIATGFAQTRTELQQESNDLAAMIGSLGEEVTQTQATVRETSQQVQTLIEDSRADRQANSQEHAAFREQFQTMLLSFTQEIRQIWQRLSA